jgi:hypothetical protein
LQILRILVKKSLGETLSDNESRALLLLPGLTKEMWTELLHLNEHTQKRALHGALSTWKNGKEMVKTKLLAEVRTRSIILASACLGLLVVLLGSCALVHYGYGYQIGFWWLGVGWIALGAYSGLRISLRDLSTAVRLRAFLLHL